ncbi:unnamed protein product [Blepharisma stoltei]|uniref:Methylcrotonoyl-CoA carboxylase subunit alpha, mitochondrial n=1 Tax=Blepharisma stoltei TaxID=1481888 RepID=A0AAU9K353_9CILI|nr:unnamed protein product [Blepharisma stoltei]
MALNFITKVLVANRGEIACRVMKTARRLGVSTVAVYSEADRNSLHVSMADHAFYIGKAPSAESYLNKSRIIDIAKSNGVQAIHPGYGFLSENAEFARMCNENGIIFIGPPASAILAMGSKSESKKIMIKAGVPVVPGYHEDSQEVEKLKQEADKIGYPVLIKAVMGGGGKGMKLVNNPNEFYEQLESAKREALKSFGDDRVIMEKYITSPRHIEFQVFADTHGNAVHLFERDCSVQRRHQKVIEEAPSMIDEEKRKDMGDKATQAALAVGYQGAGTVEFIFDEDTQKFYFMEMNTRLQVEHPVTEMITGLDLVEWQFKIASGLPLPKTQSEIKRRGHAVEARIYAENPANSFLPTSGKLLYLQTPKPSDQVRIDTGVVQGDDISVYYDPLIAKLIVWGENRDQALNIMHHSLNDYHVCGLPTNIEFLRTLCQHKNFRNYKFNTNFIPLHQKELLSFPSASNRDLAMASVCLLIKEQAIADETAEKLQRKSSPWYKLHDFRVNYEETRNVSLISDKEHKVAIKPTKSGFDVNVAKHQFNVKGKLIGNNTYELETEKGIETWRVLQNEEDLWVINSEGSVFVLKIKQEEMGEIKAQESSISHVIAPIPGKIIKIIGKEGEEAKENSVLIVIESMKMEHSIKVPRNATIKKVHKKEGDFVKAKEVIVSFE